MIKAGEFYNVNRNKDPSGINDALWCQSANNITNIGVWYYPNGTEVPLFDGDFTDESAPSPVFSKRFSGQIALARRAGLGNHEGLYKCIIPDENGVNQTLVVGAYTTGGYNSNGNYKLLYIIIVILISFLNCMCIQMVLMQIPICSFLSSLQVGKLILQSSVSVLMSLMVLLLLSVVQ